jgi:divalent metal cation (Fe/Co/Zn/Cd) transporter
LTPLRRAIRLSWLTIGWNTIVGGSAVITAALTANLALIGFGVNALIDSSVSVLLIRRFGHEEAGRHERAERGEARALHVAGGAFIAIAAYLIVQSVRALANAHHPGNSLFGLVVALASIVVLPILGLAKYRVADVLGSRALRADSMLTFFGAALAAVACIATVLASVAGWWWCDDVGALLIAALLLSEARRSFRE